MRLAEIATYVNEKISSSNITLDQYVTTDSLLQDKRGREYAQNLPPVTTKLIHYQPGDVLVANIRPYLKKVWFADCEGGASSDVLVLRAKNANDTTFVYALLMQDSFYDYAMKGAKGSKMPRGDKDQIMRYEFPIFSPEQRKDIGKFITDIESKIAVNRQINDNLEAMAKQLYDYWFVQFDFPNEEGKPYKSSGGKMVWNDKLKQEIPDGWSDSTLSEICVMYQPQTIGTDLLLPNGVYRVYGANGIVGKYDQYNHEDSEIAMACRGNSCGVVNRTMPYSWITGNAMVLQMKDKGVSNEYIKQSVSYMNISGAISGSGQPQLTRENLNIVKCLKPAHNVLLSFSQLIEPIVTAQLHIIEENDKITKLRDELLPLLMNGQVSVNYHLSHD